jgi:hypothetical protein
MILGLIGSPNKGKSTLFSAMTLAEADIADYPFTTINPNLGVAYATRRCVEVELGTKCNPRNSYCINGIRRIPVNIIDVAGLVPEAHAGKGMGNQFLNDIMSSDVFIHVIDSSGRTDISGNAAEGSDPRVEIKMVKDEIAEWLGGILLKKMPSLSKRADGTKALCELLSGFRFTEEQVEKAAASAFLGTSNILWGREEAVRFSMELINTSKPFIIAANKDDSISANEKEKIKMNLSGYAVVFCSGAIELALRKASKNGILSYDPAGGEIKVSGAPTQQQKEALSYISKYLSSHSTTGVQELINEAVFGAAKCIVVYPVENESKYSDHFDNVLPDAILMEEGSTAMDLASKIHTDIAKNMLYAIDAKRKIRITKDYRLKDGDVIKIVSAAR